MVVFFSHVAGVLHSHDVNVILSDASLQLLKCSRLTNIPSPETTHSSRDFEDDAVRNLHIWEMPLFIVREFAFDSAPPKKK